MDGACVYTTLRRHSAPHFTVVTMLSFMCISHRKKSKDLKVACDRLADWWGHIKSALCEDERVSTCQRWPCSGPRLILSPPHAYTPATQNIPSRLDFFHTQSDLQNHTWGLTVLVTASLGSHRRESLLVSGGAKGQQWQEGVAAPRSASTVGGLSNDTGTYPKSLGLK